MKAGDKIVCINGVNFGKDWKGIDYIYRLNNLYEILYLNKEENCVNIRCVDNNYLSFSLNDNHQFRFKDYFLNLREIRKLKLKKLYENR